MSKSANSDMRVEFGNSVFTWRDEKIFKIKQSKTKPKNIKQKTKQKQQQQQTPPGNLMYLVRVKLSKKMQSVSVLPVGCYGI